MTEVDKDEEIWLLSPYSTVDKLTALRRQIAQACEDGANVSFVVRDEDKQTRTLTKDLQEAMQHGLKVGAVERLHAKLYWFENAGAIVTSANLLDGSFEHSLELGLFIQPGRLHTELKSWIEAEVKPKLRLLSMSERPSKKSTGSGRSSSFGRPPKGETKRQESSHGLCIRCAQEIALDADRPYCASDFATWARFSNPDYAEPYCHQCGAPAGTSMARPLCRKCFSSNKKHRRAF